MSHAFSAPADSRLAFSAPLKASDPFSAHAVDRPLGQRAAPAAPQSCRGASAIPSAIELLEDRRLMSVVYVSNSDGNDGDKGYTEASAVRTIAKAKSLVGDGDTMLLKRGDTWNEPIGDWWKPNSTIAAYGWGNKPTIRANTDALRINRPGLDNITVRDISLVASNSTTSACGIFLIGSFGGTTIDGVSIKGFRNNINALGWQGSQRNLTIRNSHISYANGAGKSQGMFADNVKGITLENNTFDHNGGTSGSMYNHGAYITATCGGLVARGNTFSNSSNYGMQARCGGIIENNRFINNSTGLSVGIVYGDGVHTDGGVTTSVKNNHFTGVGNWRARGLGIEMGNIKYGVVSNNTFTNGTGQSYNPAILLARGTGGGYQVGILNLTISYNTSKGWGDGLQVRSDAGVRTLSVYGNSFEGQPR